LDAVVLSMAAHKKDSESQHSGCCALKAFCASTTHASLALRSGALEAVLEALQLSDEIPPATVHMAVGVLACLCATGVSGGAAVARAGGAEVLVSVLCSHRSNAAVQSYGLRALGSMTANSSTIEAAQKAGAVPAAFDALQVHSGTVAVCEAALQLLQHVASHDPAGVSPRPGDIANVVQVMQHHINYAEVQQYAALFLAALALRHSQEALDAQLTEVVADIACTHSDDPFTIEPIFVLLEKIAMSSTVAAEALLKAQNTIGATTNAADTLMAHGGIQHHRMLLTNRLEEFQPQDSVKLF